MIDDIAKFCGLSATAWLICLAFVYLAAKFDLRRQRTMKPFTHGYRNYSYDGREVHLFEFGRGTKRMTIWASDVEEAETLAVKHKFRGPYDRIAVRPQGVIGEPEGYCRGKQ